MLKYVFGAIFIGLAWALVIVFRGTVPLWVAFVVTGAVVGGLAIYALARVLAARRAAASIERGLRDQARQQNESLRPDLQAEIAAMQAEFQKSVKALKSSKLGRTGRDALAVLPWYIIIGPPGSGKTTAIRSSGLKFPFGKSSAVRGVGGTRNCDWWMANDAILLDTAGRWSTEDDDKDEWLAFLDLLKRTRPKKPVNGILVAVSITELQGEADAIVALAESLRERVDEVLARLDMVLPVYLLITKCDLVSGFVETFGDLKDRDRGQIWGFTLPLATAEGDQIETIAQHFDELGDVLDRHCLYRMGEERRIEAREKIFAFPQQLDSVRQGLIDLVAALFDRSVYEDAPIMRGIYFTSGTQEGRPVDRVMRSMADAFGVRPRLAAAPPGKPKSYFVRDLFKQVVFPDGDVAVRSTRVMRRKRALSWIVASAALVASAAFLFLPISSYLDNMALVKQSRALVEKLAQARADHGPTGPLAAAALESIEPAATRLASFAAKGPDISLRFGLYPGENLLGPVHTAVERLVVRPLLDADGDRMAEYARGGGDTEASGAMSGLMLHLLLTQPKAADEPAPENDGWRERAVDVAVNQAGERWAGLAAGTATAKARRGLESAIKYYALRASTSADLAERKVSLVTRIRAALVGSSDGDPLTELERDPSLPRAVRVVDVVGGAVTAFVLPGDPRAGPSVPGAFTPPGWKIIKAHIARMSADREHDENAWVLGTARARTKIDASALQAAYFRRYVDAWRTFLLSLSIKEPTNIADVRSLLRTLTTEKPLDAIWRNAGKNLVFTDESLLDAALAKGKDAAKVKLPGDGDAGGAARRNPEVPTTPGDVGAEFGSWLNFGLTKPTGLDAYGDILAEIAAAVGESGAPDPKAFASTVKAQHVKLSDLIQRYNESGWEGSLLEKILMPPLLGAEVAVTGATGEAANRKWCDTIVVVYDQLFAGKYPFANGKNARDARVSDVDKFFAPKTGTLSQYFAESLQADIDHPAGTTVFHLKDQPSVAFKPSLMTFLKRAQEITDLLYGKDPAKLGIPLEIRIRPSAPYTKIVFESGDHKVTYFNSTEHWEDLTWPARGALFRYFQKGGEGELGYTDGEWALFRLIEAGKLSSSSEGDEYLAGTWTPPLGEGAIRADLKPAGLLRAFHGLEVPRSIVAGVGSCGK
jgi:type VI secretion system protein ImpL